MWGKLDAVPGSTPPYPAISGAWRIDPRERSAASYMPSRRSNAGSKSSGVGLLKKRGFTQSKASL